MGYCFLVAIKKWEMAAGQWLKPVR